MPLLHYNIQIQNFLIARLFSAIIKMNKEDCGRSVHNWSSQKRVRFALPNRLKDRKTRNLTKENVMLLIFLSGAFLIYKEMGLHMDNLLQKYNDYIRLKNCRAEYQLSNGTFIQVTYKEENFIHLLGLHKLADIQLIQLFNDKSNKIVKSKYIISRIKKAKFTDAMVKSSVFYTDIAERYNNFSYDYLTTLTYTDAVINFNPAIINSKIKSDYLLFEETANKEYNHLGIALDKSTGNRYMETFFHQKTDMYISGQTIVKVEQFTLYSPDNKIIITDSF